MPTVYLWEYWWSCVPFCYTLKEVKSLPQVNKNLFGWKHLNLFCVYLRTHAFLFMIDQVFGFFRYSFCIIFLSFSSIEKKHRKWYITIVWTQLEKKQHFYTMNKKQPFFEKAYFHSPNAKHKIHKNNKMHFYKNYNSTLYNTDSPCWIILFPRHLSYHHTTTTLYVHCDI